jgi:hypothetical protein
MERRDFLKWLLVAASLPPALRTRMESEVAALPKGSGPIAVPHEGVMVPLQWKPSVVSSEDLPMNEESGTARYVERAEGVFVRCEKYGWVQLTSDRAS